MSIKFGGPVAKDIAVLVALVTSIVVVGALATDPYTQTIVSTVCIYLIASAGFNVLSGYAGQMSLGHAGFMAVGAYTAAIGYREWEWPIIVSLLVGVLAAGVVGALVAIPALRLHGPYLAMVTLAFGIMVYQFAQQFVSITGGPGGISIPRPELWGSVALSGDQLFFLTLLAAGLAIVVSRNLVTSRWGRALRALHANDLVASSLGINSIATKIMAFVFSAMLTGLAGVLLAYNFAFVSPDLFAFHVSIFILAVTMFGGLGSVWGPVLGAVLLVGIDSRFLAQTSYQHFLYGAILLVVVMLAPNGVVGLARKLKRRRASGEPITVGQAEDVSSETTREVREEPRKLLPRSPILVAEGLSKTFGQLKAVDGVDLKVRGGTIHGLIGPNGAGKSTLLDLITGTQSAQSGFVNLEGEDVSGLPAYARAVKGVSRTFQTGGLFPEFTVLDNVMTGAHARLDETLPTSLLHSRTLYREEGRAAREARSLLKTVGLLHLGDWLAGDLSYGDRRLVEIARALAARPRVLFLDEPAAGLNPAEQKRLSGVLRGLSAQGMGIVLVEHHMDMVMSLCDEITVLDQGRKIAEGAPKSILASEHVVRAYLGTKGVSA